MAANSRQNIPSAARTETTADRATLDTFTAVAAGRAEKETHEDANAGSEAPAVVSDGSDTPGSVPGDQQDEATNSGGSGLTLGSTHDPGSAANLIQADSSGGEIGSSTPPITVGAGSDSRSDANMLVPAEEPAEHADADTAAPGDVAPDDASVRAENGADSGSGSLDVFAPVASSNLPSEFRNAPAAAIQDGTGGTPIAAVASGPPVEQAPVDGPSLIPGTASLIGGDAMRGDGGQGSLAPDVTPGRLTGDQFGLDLGQGALGTTRDSAFDLSQLGLQSRGDDLDSYSAHLGTDAGQRIDSDFHPDALGQQGGVDGRLEPGMGGLDGLGSSTATGPADPSDMIRSGTGGKGSLLTTNADSRMSAAEAEVDELIAGMQAGTRHNPYVLIQEEIVGSVVDVPAADAEPQAVEQTEGDTKSNAEIKKEQWNHVGEDVPSGGHSDGGLLSTTGETTWLESWKALFKDQAEGELISPSEGGLGSLPAASIVRSLQIGLGGQRGGDVDPFDDPQASPSGGDQIFDPYDSVIDPGPDGFATNPDIDSSILGGPLDAVAPRLADE